MFAVRSTWRVLGLCTWLAALATSAASEPGLTGRYYEIDYPGDPVPVAFQRTDPVIDFAFGAAPAGLTPDATWSVRWTGYVRIDAAGFWSFNTLSSDGVRLRFDDELILDQWNRHGIQNDAGAVFVPSADWYPIELDFYNYGGAGRIQLSFEGPGTAPTVIPSTHLSTIDPNPGRLTADAGHDVILTTPTATHTLQAQIESAEGAFSALWRQVQGPQATILTPFGLNTELSFTDPGSYLFELLVVTQDGQVDSDTVRVLVFGDAGTATLGGEARKWHKVSLTMDGDFYVEDSGVNPFTDARMQVHFVHPASGSTYEVPGFFAADGDAANSSSKQGNAWRVNFTPDQAGDWLFLVSFRTGPFVSIDLDPFAGSPSSIDGYSGSFYVAPSSTSETGFHRQGRLEYVGQGYKRFRDTGEYYLKGGADSPENFLGYYEFDSTFDIGGPPNALNNSVYGDGLHHYDAHLADYAGLGGGLWKGTQGQRIQGALNYLATKGMNSVYFLTYNSDFGDGQEVWPWTVWFNKLFFDVSKLAQWGIVFDHMTELGLAMNVVTQERENDQIIDWGNLGPERKLYYRELVARFSHNLAVTWNLGEENRASDGERMSFADYLRALDPYDHPITVHTSPSQVEQIYEPLLGFENFDGPALQIFPDQVYEETVNWSTLSEQTGRPWVVQCDELMPAEQGVVPDSVDFWHTNIRRDALWGNLMALGAGIEYYFGYTHPNDDLTCEDWRSRDQMWNLTHYAISRFHQFLPFWEMERANDLTSTPDDWVLAQRGEVYAVYQKFSTSTDLDLEGSTDTFTVDWINPRFLGALLSGSVETVTGPGVVSLGDPPFGGDAFLLVRRVGNSPPALTDFATFPNEQMDGLDFAFQLRIDDPDGPGDIRAVKMDLWEPLSSLSRSDDEGPRGPYAGNHTFTHMGGDLWALFFPELTTGVSGEWLARITIRDYGGNRILRERRFFSNGEGSPDPQVIDLGD